ncbi:16908_t:CDS:2 [Funneliformis geosporum]|uniref:16908_t:CDS:1 n=1 Tax=Funneliformis geosporum TaxID=1117311 RepID=A0A9W4T2Q7_9GLOM|nr:16908_t:CDS:2 [Funneliformis geosporum]
MHYAQKSLPAYLERSPHNIVLYYKGYKAEEWAVWIIMYSLPLLKGKMPQKHYEGWANFVKAMHLCQKLLLTLKDIDDIQFYGQVEYYLVYEFEEQTYMLAYVYWAANIIEDNIGLISFQKYDAHEFIDLSAIDCCIGFFQLRNTYYVIDKKFDEKLDEEYGL